MHTPPSWAATASDNAMISRAELLAWLGVEASTLWRYVRLRQFPPPRQTGPNNITGVLTKTCRWRVGDVRQWLRQGAADMAPIKSAHVNSLRRHDVIAYTKRGRKKVVADHHNSDMLEPSSTTAGEEK